MRLVELAGQGWTIVIVSPSGAFPKMPGLEASIFQRYVNGPNRVDNLLAAKADHPNEEFYLYVSDNPGDDQVAASAGFAFMHPTHFR